MKNTKMNTVTFAAVGAAMLAFAPVGAQAQDILTSKVVSPSQAAQVDLGSKKALGYYGKQNGKCELTVMVVEAVSATGVSNSSAARMRVAIAPGATAKIDSDQGRTVAFFCGAGARRMTVMTLGKKTTPQT